MLSAIFYVNFKTYLCCLMGKFSNWEIGFLIDQDGYVLKLMKKQTIIRDCTFILCNNCIPLKKEQKNYILKKVYSLELELITLTSGIKCVAILLCTLR